MRLKLIKITYFQISISQKELEELKKELSFCKKEIILLNNDLSSKNGLLMDMETKFQNINSIKQKNIALEVKYKDLENENLILKENNSALLDSAYKLNREHEFQTTEKALKLKILQLEKKIELEIDEKNSIKKLFKAGKKKAKHFFKMKNKKVHESIRERKHFKFWPMKIILL